MAIKVLHFLSDKTKIHGLVDLSEEMVFRNELVHPPSSRGGIRRQRRNEFMGNQSLSNCIKGSIEEMKEIKNT